MASMKIALIILVLILTQTVCGMGSMDIQSGEEHHRHHRHHRDTKYLETLKRKRCGPQMLDAVIDACKESCQPGMSSLFYKGVVRGGGVEPKIEFPGSEVDISTICCSDQCDYSQIRKACCPMKK
ncbi:hypothetical protein CAEBREN_12800 [Caenorhabditis brenneri]|uniref:Uncharacterized protein n=1 Tax=Caenorhabditis brenneri TaxID=135651 RepID=G0MYL4_CAEBE|nr:hypothetical protein CAEBREN_12800 [Caenorhabditis brenneri]